MNKQLSKFGCCFYSILDFPLEYRVILEKRFWSKVEKTDSCWIWKGSKNRVGYGVFYIETKPTKRMMSHRVAFELSKGAIPEGKTLDHLCRNPSCVNPDHLEAVTMRENILRGNGIGVKSLQKTHCSKGHALVEGNIRPDKLKKFGWRMCLTCDRESARNYQRRKRFEKSKERL